MNIQYQNMKLWSLKDWEKYLDNLGHKISSVETRNKEVVMWISRYMKDEEGKPVHMFDIKFILPL